jgi:hypothetical protein
LISITFKEGSSCGEPFFGSVYRMAQYLLAIALDTQDVIRGSKAMRNTPRYTVEASFRPRELRDYNEPVLGPSIRLQVRLNFWQRLMRAVGLQS